MTALQVAVRGLFRELKYTSQLHYTQTLPRVKASVKLAATPSSREFQCVINETYSPQSSGSNLDSFRASEKGEIDLSQE